MSFDISGKGGTFSTNNHAWGRLLALAFRYGWEPVGTTAPNYERIFQPKTPSEEEACAPARSSWDGNYITNDFQTVEDDDATAFGAALERALAANDPALAEIWGVKELSKVALAGAFCIG
jgi:hypothetical protein